MLPERLSADLCSLVDNADRPCLAVRMVFDRARQQDAPRIPARHDALGGDGSPMQQAQRAFDGDPDPAHRDIHKTVLAPLWNAYKALAAARDRRDPLDLDLPERRIMHRRGRQGRSIAFRERLESMRLIEEMMILANVAAAESLEKARMPLHLSHPRAALAGKAVRLLRLSADYRT